MLINVVKNCRGLKTLGVPWCSMAPGGLASLCRPIFVRVREKEKAGSGKQRCAYPEQDYFKAE